MGGGYWRQYPSKYYRLSIGYLVRQNSPESGISQARALTHAHPTRGRGPPSVKSFDNGMTPPTSGWKPSGSTVATRSAFTPPPVGPPSVAPTRLPSAPRERKPALAALALLLVVVGVLASVYLQIQSRDQVGVIEITSQVAQGQQITGSDISEVMVAKNSNINYVLWSQQSLLSKYSATTGLVPGTLLIGQMLSNQIAGNPNQVLIPLVLKDGDYPVGVTLGQVVIAYDVPGPNAGSSSDSTAAPVAGPIDNDVTIISMPDESSANSGDSSSDDFTVSVDKASAPLLLQASALGTLVLVAPAAGG